jgi:hypothetical protein
MEVIPFTIASKTIKCLGINFMMETKDLFNENCKPLKRKFKENIRRWKDLPCSWIGRINIIKMTILLKIIYIFNEIPIKISMTFFSEIEKSILKYIWKHKRPQIPKAILSKIAMLKVSQFLTSSRYKYQWNRIEDPRKKIKEAIFKRL